MIAEGGVRVVSLADGLEVTDYDQDGITWSSISLDSPDGRVAVLVGSAEQADVLVKAATKIRRRLAKAEACEAARAERTAMNEAAAERLPAVADGFVCCDTRMAWPAKTEDRTCPECGTVWEREPVDIGAGARIKSQPPGPGQRYDVLIPATDGGTNLAADAVTGEQANELAAQYEGAEIVPHPDHVSPPSPPEPKPLPEGRAGTIALIPAAVGIDPGEFHGRLVLDALRRNPAVAGARAHMAGRKVWRQNGTAAYLRAVLAEIDSLAGAA